MTDSTPYFDHLIDPPDVCNNCFALIRVERIDPKFRADKFVVDRRDQIDTTYERRIETTEIGYGPADCPPRSKGVFCECGTERASHRVWDTDNVSRERFREFVKHALQTLGAKGVTLRRKETAAYALQAFDDGAGVDQALAEAIDAGIVAAAAAQESTDQLRADGGR